MTVRFTDVPPVAKPTVAKPTEPRYREMGHLVAVGKRGKGPGELWRPRGVAIDPNTNQIYVAESGRVSIFSETGEFLNAFSHERMKSPYGVAVYGDNVYVTDSVRHSVLRYTMPGFRLVGSLGGLGNSIGRFDDPRQPAVSAEGEVFVPDCGNNRIQVLECNLRFSRQISHHSMLEPRDVKLTQDSVFVLSFGSPCVQVFSYAGRKKRSLLTRLCFGRTFANPHFFCLDASLNLILSEDRSEHRIKIFSRKGTLLFALGKCGNEVGKFRSPHGVALTSNLKLVVVSWNNNFGLQIFSCQ